MTKLYHDPDAGIWVVPGQQAKGAERVDVPNGPEDLAHWLNMRRVKPNGEGHLGRAIAAEALGAPPVPPPSGETVPDATERCPRCRLTLSAAAKLAAGQDVDAIAEWIFVQPIHMLERLFAAIGARVGELRKRGE